MNSYLVTSAIALTTLMSTATWAAEATLTWTDERGFESVAGCESSMQAAPAQGPFAKLGDQVIEITEANPLTQTSPFPLRGSYWQAVGAPSSFEVLSCPGTISAEFLIFAVHLPDHPESIHKVAVPLTGAALFKYSKFHSSDRADLDFMSSTGAVRPETPLRERVQATPGTMEYVVCTRADQLNVRDESLTKVLFQVRSLEGAKPVQSFGTDEVQKTIDGKTYSFIKVQFPNRAAGSNLGFVAEDYIKLKSECGGQTPPAKDISATPSWTFPTNKRASVSYKSGMRRFLASRSGGTRWHAACDIYRVQGEEAVSVSSGQVIRDRYYFYQGTYAIEVRHTGGKVVRYGEVTGKAAPGIALNRPVTAGQVIGYVGKVNSGCCTPMLHFEMYSGTASGALSQGGNKFNRRLDLIDPSSYLTDWEKQKFGTSY